MVKDHLGPIYDIPNWCQYHLLQGDQCPPRKNWLGRLPLSAPWHGDLCFRNSSLRQHDQESHGGVAMNGSHRGMLHIAH